MLFLLFVRHFIVIYFNRFVIKRILLLKYLNLVQIKKIENWKRFQNLFTCHTDKRWNLERFAKWLLSVKKTKHWPFDTVHCVYRLMLKQRLIHQTLKFSFGNSWKSINDTSASEGWCEITLATFQNYYPLMPMTRKIRHFSFKNCRYSVTNTSNHKYWCQRLILYIRECWCQKQYSQLIINFKNSYLFQTKATCMGIKKLFFIPFFVSTFDIVQSDNFEIKMKTSTIDS